MKLPRLIITFFVILILPVIAFSQEIDIDRLIEENNYQEVKLINTAGGFSMIDRWPMFPDGQTGIFKFLNENIAYPPKAKRKGIHGKVTVGFMVQTDGTVSEIHIVGGAHHLLDKEAMRVFELMDNWLPAIQRGKPVKVAMQQVVNFEL
jgi:TonB family protein